MTETNNTPLGLLKAAQAEAMNVVNQVRLSLLKALAAADEIKADDEYEAAIMAILAQCPEGIEQSKLHWVLPDIAKLRSAKDKLIKEGKISEGKNGTRKHLTKVD